jgi:hypothetical protein
MELEVLTPSVGAGMHPGIVERGRSLRVAALAGLLGSAIPATATALAGFSESTRVLVHSERASVLFSEPADDCENASGFVGGYCFHLVYPNGSRETIPGLIAALDSVSVPTAPASPFVLVRTQRDAKWILYDLAASRPVLETNDFDRALLVWRELGLRDPILADVNTADGHFRETWSSRAKRAVGYDGLLWPLPAVLAVLGAVGLVFVTLFLARPRRRRRMM